MHAGTKLRWHEGALLFLLMMASSANAQRWSVEAQAGRIRSTLDPTATASQTIVAGLRYDDDLTGFRVSGGFPTQSGDPVWGSIAGTRRLQVEANRFKAGVDLMANGFVVGSSGGSAFAGQVLPLVGYTQGNIEATLRGGVSQYSSSFSSVKSTRRVSLADAQVSITPSLTLALIPNARFIRADEGDYTFAGFSAVTANGPLTLWGTAGSWLKRAIDTGDSFTYAAGASIKVLSAASVNLSARHEAIDPMYMTPPQNSWTAGVSINVGGKPASAAAIPARFESGRAVIKLSSNKAAPKIAGDFNNWKPQAMTKVGGDWTYSVALKPGVYNFAFVDANGDWFVPEKYPGRKSDGMGGYVAVLIVQ